MHFVISAFSNHVEVLHNVTTIDLLAQSAVQSDGVVAAVLHNVTPIDLLAQSVVLSDRVVASYLHKYSASTFPSFGGVSSLCIL